MQLLNGLRNRYFKELVQSSGIVFIASVISNIFSLLYSLFMVRRLSIVDYGILNSLFSLLMILSLPTGTLQTLVTKFVAQFKGQGHINQIYHFLIYLGKRILIFGIICFALFLVISPFISSFLKLTSPHLILMIGIILFFSFLVPLPAGAILGLQHFLALSIYGMIAALLKLVLSVTLVIIGFGISGALGGILLSVIISFIIVIFMVPREIFHDKLEKISAIDFISVYKFLLPAAVSYFCFMALINSDVILVRHFFSSLEAGYYSIVQMVGKIIIFLPSAVAAVIFPKMVNAFNRKEKVSELLKQGLLMTGLLCISASVFCIIFPSFVLKILTNKDCFECTGYVPLFCIAMTFYALVNILLAYYLSIHRYQLIYFLVLGCILQIGLISLFHQSLIQILYILTLNSAFLFTLGIVNVNWKSD